MGEKHIKEVEPEFLSTATIAKRINRCTETVRREIKRGKLRAFQFNGDYLVRLKDFEDWKAKNFIPVK